MDNIMKYLQLILLGLAMFIVPTLPSLVLCGLSLIYFRKHDWTQGFFYDKWGTLGILSFLFGLAVFLGTAYSHFLP
jgi:hypothetical protein